MAQTKVSALTALTTPDGAEELYINDGGTSKKITIANAIIAGTGITKSGATISAAPVALTTIQTAANQVAQLALTTEEGDVVVRTDESKTYMRNSGSAGNMTDFTEMATPTDAVTSVVGQTGVVSTAQIKTALENGIDSVHYVDGSIDTVHIGDDQVTVDKLANSINTEIAANTAKTGITGGQASAITANTAKVTNATHSGEVTGDTALTIADDIVDEANLKVSNAPTNGQYLQAQSGAGGGLTWAGIDANTTTKGLYEHAYTISADYVIASGNNAVTAGPITIDSGVSVTVPSASTWVII